MAADDDIRERVGNIPVPEFTTTPCTMAPPLARSRVAIVTTAGLRPAGLLDLWAAGDGSFQELPAAARDLQLAHCSPNFDRSGVAADLNVVYPADRLEEMAQAGEIGSVAERHLSFMGAQTDPSFSSILLDSGPAAARLLIDQGVDVVLLTPV
jgi:Glycine/sarcosine/betaine reductase selenoprotein B (GRDB)